MTEPVRAAVVGVGHFGRYHAQKYAARDDAELVAVVDADAKRAEAIARELNTTALADPRDLIGRVEAASVAVPTRHHHAVARQLLDAGIHLLIEKPIAATLREAVALIEVAEARNLKLQVGHLERFNPAVLALDDVLGPPLFVESLRISGFQPRVTDVNVVLDLMIHDIDLIQHLVGSPLASCDACGVPVLSHLDDIVSARLHFESGCVANVTASRIAQKGERKMRIFQNDLYVSIDFHARHAAIARRGTGEMFPGIPDIDVEQRDFEANDALMLEIEHFLAAVRGERPVAVSGEEGLRALETALVITDGLIRPPL